MEEHAGQSVEWVEGDTNLSSSRQPFVEAWADESAKAILDEDERVFLHQSLSTPCINTVERAEGIYLIDTAGRKIMDFHGNGVHHLGFAHPAILNALIEQAQTLPFSTRRYTNSRVTELGRRLGQLTEGKLTKLLLAPAGTLAISTALKLARIATGRHRTISMDGAFHGASLDAIAVGGQQAFKDEIGPLPPGAINVPQPAHTYENSDYDLTQDESLTAIEAAFREHDDIAALVAEPVRWTSVEVPSVKFWQRVRELCTQNGALLIMDEIGTGFGRTGRMFAYELFDITPDIICLGKGFGGGVFPLAGILAKPELDVTGHLSIGHYTHEKTPVGAAVALATLDVIEQQNLLTHVKQLESEGRVRLQQLVKSYPQVQSYRAIGAMYAIELGDSPGLPADVLAERVMLSALRRGMNFKVTGKRVLTLTPPLVITADELSAGFDIVAAALDESIDH